MVRNPEGSMRQHQTKSPHLQGMILFGALVKLNSPVFQVVGQFLNLDGSFNAKYTDIHSFGLGLQLHIHATQFRR